MSRTYLASHPWITFRVDFSDAPPAFWMMLGEAQSKCAHLAGVPLRPAVHQHLHRIYLAKGVRATTAIEGNTLSEEDVLRAVEGELEVPPSKEYLKREVENIIGACNRIGTELLADEAVPLTPERICALHAWVFEGLESEETGPAGLVRRHSVGVGRYRGAPAEDCGFLLEQLCAWLNSDQFVVTGPLRLAHGILRAILAHLYLAWIHPFGDGNGRTARLLELQLLIEAGVPTPAAHLLSNHYNDTRAEYYRMLDRSSSTPAGALEFVRYALEGFVDGLRGQIEVVRRQVMEVCWKDFVSSRFEGDTSATSWRRRDLVLALSRVPNPVSLDGLRLIAPEVERHYRQRGDRTLLRDVQFLIAEGLVRQRPGGYVANFEAIQAFLPARAGE